MLLGDRLQCYWVIGIRVNMQETQTTPLMAEKEQQKTKLRNNN